MTRKGHVRFCSRVSGGDPAGLGSGLRERVGKQYTGTQRTRNAVHGECTVELAKWTFLIMVVFQKWRWPFLHRPSKGIAVDKQANHDVMHLRGFREADRLADQAFNTRP